jgi:tape measure domain-containing protein
VSVVANVAINVDSRNAVGKLRQVQQGAQATSQAVDKLNATTKAAGAASAGAASQFQAAANGMRAQQKAAGSLLGSISRLASAYLSLRVAQQAVQAGIKREESERRLTFLAQGYNEVARAQILASQSGKRFGLSATESNQQFAQLYGRLRPLNISIEDINAAFIGFNTAAKVSGTSTAETAGALLQLTQALGSGVLRGQELNSVLEQAPGLVVALTKELGVPVSTLRKLAEEGKITSDVVINALKRAGIEGAGQLEAALKGPAQSVKNLQNSFEDFQIGLTNDVIPAVVELLKGITSILGAFNKLPGPVKTITAAALGLTAAFVALAPAISATIGLLGGLSLATLAAAGPWIALAAGVTAAAVALAGYRSESQKVGGAARGGDASNLAAASKLLAQKDAQIAGLQGQRQTASGRQRASIDRNLAVLRRERAQLQSDVKAGTAATPAATAGNAMGTPVGATVGGGGAGAKKGGDDAKRAAEQMQQQLKAANDINFALKNRLAIAQTTEPVAKRMLEYDVKQNEIAKEYDELKKVAKSADELALINANLVIEQRIAQVEYEREINELLIERATLVANLVKASSMPTVYNELEEQDAALQAILDKYPAIGSAADAAATLATSGIAAMIDGTKSAEQVFVEFLSSIADALIDTAKQMIAQYIAIGIARMFAGMGGSGNFAPSGPLAAVGNVNTDVSGFFAPSANGNAFGANGIIPFAKGGIVNSPTLFPFAKGVGLMGEAGPEAILPLSRGPGGKLGVMASGGGGDVNVVVNVDAKGSSVEGNEQGANQLGRVISAAVQSELIKQQRPGGILAR